MNMKKLLQPKALIIIGVALVGGLFLASRLRPKGGSSASTDEEEAVIARPILQPYAVDPNPPAYSGGIVAGPSVPGPSIDGPSVLPSPAKPVPTPTPPVKPTPTPQPTPGLPAPPQKPGTGSPGQLPKPPTPIPTPLPGTPRREPTPTPPSVPPATPNVPGGYPLDCRGVLPRPQDHPGANPAQLVAAKGGGARGRAIVLEWAIMGIATSGQTGLSRFTQWAANKAYWPVINQNRRNRGLKALTETQFNQMITQLHQLNAQNKGQDSAFNDAQLLQLWSTWHVPYLC